MLVVLTEMDQIHIRDYLEEIDALVDADDECIFTMPFLDKHDIIKEIFNDIG